MWSEPFVDILDVAPKATIDDAYTVQADLMRRRVERGDRIIGFKAAGTTRDAQSLLGDQPYPIVGTLLHSQLLDDGEVYETRPGVTFVEAEIGILIRKAITDPNISYLDALAAIDCFVPAMEISPWSPAAADKKRSFQQVIATQKINGKVVIGRNRVSPYNFDPRYEGAVVEVDGRIVATGTGAEVMGDPIVAMIAIVKRILSMGLEIPVYSFFMTGSVAPPYPGKPDIRSARVTFTRMGSIQAQFRQAC